MPQNRGDSDARCPVRPYCTLLNVKLTCWKSYFSIIDVSSMSINTFWKIVLATIETQISPLFNLTIILTAMFCADLQHTVDCIIVYRAGMISSRCPYQECLLFSTYLSVQTFHVYVSLVPASCREHIRILQLTSMLCCGPAFQSLWKTCFVLRSDFGNCRIQRSFSQQSLSLAHGQYPGSAHSYKWNYWPLWTSEKYVPVATSTYTFPSGIRNSQQKGFYLMSDILGGMISDCSILDIWQQMFIMLSDHAFHFSSTF